MIPTASDNQVFVDQVVSTLTEPTIGVDGETLLREQMQRATDEFDEHTAQAFGRALLDSLCQDPSDVRRLEALMILGLAHPVVLEENRIPLVTEGRRLAVLLEHAGESDRARCLLEVLAARVPDEESVDRDLVDMMRRTGGTAQLIDRYMERANEAVQDGRQSDAIPWLQQILLLDRNRRDVARMIRDLRYEDSERTARIRRRTRLIAMMCFVSALVTGVVFREWRIEEQYSKLPEVHDSDLASMQARLMSVEDLIESKTFWVGMFRAVSERSRLLDAIALQESRTQDEAVEEQNYRERRTEMAEAARRRGLEAAERGDLDAALSHLRRAFELAEPDWIHGERVAADIAAIEGWRKEQE